MHRSRDWYVNFTHGEVPFVPGNLLTLVHQNSES